jgi:hypothetical protein
MQNPLLFTAGLTCSAPYSLSSFCLAPRDQENKFSRPSRSLHSKPDSVEGSNLSGMIVANHLKRHFTISRDTALHIGRKFSRFNSLFPETSPLRGLRLSPSTSLLASLGLPRRALPATVLRLATHVSGLSSPPFGGAAA